MNTATRSDLCVSLCLLMAFGAGSVAQEPAQPRKPSTTPGAKQLALLSAKVVKEAPNDDALRRLLKARYNEALGEVKGYYEAEDAANRGDISRLSSSKCEFP
jgi:hypothetical protein